MYALNNVETTDDWSASGTLECAGTTELNLLVNNAAIRLQYAFRRMGYTSHSPAWEPAEGVFFPPGGYVRGRNVEQVRVKSAVKGKPAQVTIEAVG
jgi:hypothetical protein